MENLSQFWLSTGVLIMLGIAAILWVTARLARQRPPQDDDSVVLPEMPLPAPTFLGVLMLKPIYQKGERFTFQTTPQVAGCGAEMFRFGIADNNTGPYGVILRAYERATGALMPVYIHDGGPECSGVAVPSGVFDIYLMGKRPYSAIGSALACDTFVPRKAELPRFILLSESAAPLACNPPQPLPPPENLPANVVECVLEVTVENQYGRTSGPYTQTILVDVTGCE